MSNSVSHLVSLVRLIHLAIPVGDDEEFCKRLFPVSAQPALALLALQLLCGLLNPWADATRAHDIRIMWWRACDRGRPACR
jgi:hypothetical protein